jgi:pimeloyl-ACP methyl ester carboxylesterase
MSELICPQFTTIDGLTIRFAESGQGSQDAILLSPWPESVYAFQQSWARLAEHAHLLAIDPPGFGHSEYREALMNPKAMGDFIVGIADAFGLENPHLVGPDIGTSSSLFAADLQPYHQMGGRKIVELSLSTIDWSRDVRTVGV